MDQDERDGDENAWPATATHEEEGMFGGVLHKAHASLDASEADCSMNGLMVLCDVALQRAENAQSLKKDKTKQATTERRCRRLHTQAKALQKKVIQLTEECKEATGKLEAYNIPVLERRADEGDPQAQFLKEQLEYLLKIKPHWSEETVRNCILWNARSPAAYRYVRDAKFLKLPSLSTLKRYVGPCTGDAVTSLIQQRLVQEAGRHGPEALRGSLILDEMSIEQCESYQRQGDVVHGLVDLGGRERELGLETTLATHLLCFIFVGLSTQYRIPVSYYFTKALNGDQAYHLVLDVMAAVQEAGFFVCRVVADNHATNCSAFARLAGGKIAPVIDHPLDVQAPRRLLFLSFDYCHIIKNIRSQFLDNKRLLCNNGCYILPKYIRQMYDIQNRIGGAFRPARCLTRKHLYPSNFEKMNVKRAVEIFSPPVTAALRYLQEYGDSLGHHGFDDSLPTIEFMELVYKWFVLHNVKSTTRHIFTRDEVRMPFYDADDERLHWLESDVLAYFNVWAATSPAKAAFLTDATYEAFVITTKATVLCTRNLLDSGFHYVLTGKFSSDAVESLFSSIRQLNGANDRTDARSALSALHKILVTGVIQSSPSANVNGTRSLIGENCALPLRQRPETLAHLNDAVLREKLEPYIQALIMPVSPPPGLKTAALALVAGFLVRVVKEKGTCEACLKNVEADASPSAYVKLVYNLDRGGLSYPTLPFVGLV
ncbi:uncharacterized protein LOC135379168 [Ornithodoros turicata]|uniref:uncharacterized protein LOC135379168 n=1 Tax=Ornithodoros turicata TaxID=34597 RepID=UPI0031396CA8